MKKISTLLFQENIAFDMAIGALLSVGFVVLGFLSRSFALDLQVNLFNVL